MSVQDLAIKKTVRYSAELPSKFAQAATVTEDDRSGPLTLPHVVVQETIIEREDGRASFRKQVIAYLFSKRIAQQVAASLNQEEVSRELSLTPRRAGEAMTVGEILTAAIGYQPIGPRLDEIL